MPGRSSKLSTKSFISSQSSVKKKEVSYIVIVEPRVANTILYNKCFCWYIKFFHASEYVLIFPQDATLKIVASSFYICFLHCSHKCAYPTDNDVMFLSY